MKKWHTSPSAMSARHVRLHEEEQPRHPRDLPYVQDEEGEVRGRRRGRGLRRGDHVRGWAARRDEARDAAVYCEGADRWSDGHLLANDIHSVEQGACLFSRFQVVGRLESD